MIPAPGNHFVLREAIGADQSLKGRKIRAIATFEGTVRALVGTPLNMAPSDAFAAMQKGVIDGIAFPAFASADQKIILDEGRKLEVTAAKALLDHEREDIEALVKNGVALTTFDGKTGASLNRLYNEGILATASKSTPNEVKSLYELARSKNLLNE